MDFGFYFNGVCSEQKNDTKLIILKNILELGCTGVKRHQGTHSGTGTLMPLRDDSSLGQDGSKGSEEKPCLVGWLVDCMF